MRTVPFRVVALVGMSDGVFPRVVRPLAFDHLTRAPRPGDRTPRDDDRYLFLEAILSARERLLITYAGHSITDNGELPPSVVVSELIDAIDAAARTPDGGAAGAAVVHHHPLQPFSPNAFPRSGPLVSFARSQHAGALALCAPRAEVRPFIAGAMSADPIVAVTVDDLIAFFNNPSGWFLRQRLRLTLPRDDEAPDDREPVELSHLQRWDVGQRLLDQRIAGAAPDVLREVLRATGILPLGTPGRALVDEQLAVASTIAEAAIARGIAALAEPAEVAVSIDGIALTGLLRGRGPAGLVHAQFSRVGGRRELEMWIRHLVLNATIAPGAESVLIGRAKTGAEAKRTGSEMAIVRFLSPADAAAHLRTLLALFRRGQTSPLPFFRNASREYVECLRKTNGTPAGARGNACEKFAGGEYQAGDAEDPSVALLYPQRPAALRDDTPLDLADDFFTVAQAVFEPLLQHRKVDT
jgi:exodeoxyribonuclease V gamma subunit